MRVAQRAIATARAPLETPRMWCTRCGRTRHHFKVHGSPRRVYACPQGCDDYDPARGQI